VGAEGWNLKQEMKIVVIEGCETGEKMSKAVARVFTGMEISLPALHSEVGYLSAF
jgi:hypothetical protein